MTDSTPATAATRGRKITMTDTAPCPSTYGVLVCERPVVGLHGARLASGELVMWGDGCDETCTADCGHCKGRLRRDTESTHA